MTKPMPPTDWKRHWPTYLGHIALGILTAQMIATTGWGFPGMLLGIAFLVYQYVEFKRRGDTPARDIAHWMWGLVPVLVAEYLWFEHLVDRVMPHLG